MKKLLIASLLLLNGCAFYVTPHAKVWVMCYRHEQRLNDGTYQSDVLQFDGCNKREQLQFSYKFGNVSADPLAGFDKYKQEH